VGNHWDVGLNMRYWEISSLPEKRPTLESADSAATNQDSAQENERPGLSCILKSSQSHETVSTDDPPEQTDNGKASTGVGSGRLVELASSLWGKLSFSGIGFTGT